MQYNPLLQVKQKVVKSWVALVGLVTSWSVQPIELRGVGRADIHRVQFAARGVAPLLAKGLPLVGLMPSRVVPVATQLLMPPLLAST